jgi:hypothetical protein
MNGHPASSMAQRYNVKPDPMEGVSGMHNYDGPDIPLPQKPSTTGSVNQRIAWRTPSGAAQSAQSMGSTLFDVPSTAAQMPRPEGS